MSHGGSQSGHALSGERQDNKDFRDPDYREKDRMSLKPKAKRTPDPKYRKGDNNRTHELMPDKSNGGIGQSAFRSH